MRVNKYCLSPIRYNTEHVICSFMTAAQLTHNFSLLCEWFSHQASNSQYETIACVIQKSGNRKYWKKNVKRMIFFFFFSTRDVEFGEG